MLPCSEIDTLLEAFVDEALEPDQSQKVRDHVAACSACRVKLKLAYRITGELRSLPAQTCPDSVVQNVFAKMHSKEKKKRSWPLPSLFLTRPRYALGFSLGLAVILVVLVSLSIYHPGFLLNWQQPHYTDEEIAQAKKDIYLALGYVNYATSRTQHIIEKDVVPQKVIRPIQKSLDHIHTTKEKGGRQ